MDLAKPCWGNATVSRELTNESHEETNKGKQEAGMEWREGKA